MAVLRQVRPSALFSGDEPPHPHPESDHLLPAGPEGVPARVYLHGVAAAAQQGAHVRDLVLHPGHLLDQVARLLGRPAGGPIQGSPYLLHVPLGNKRGPAGSRPRPQSGQALLLVSPYHLMPQDLAMPRCFAAPVRVIPSRSTCMTSIVRLATSASFSVLYALMSSSTVDFLLSMGGGTGGVINECFA